MSRTTSLLGLLVVVVTVEAVSIVLGGAVDGMLVYAPGVDKVLHVLAFAAIFVVCNTLSRPWIPQLQTRLMVLGIGLFLLAAGDELGQGLRPDRDVDWRDFVGSISGVLLGAAWSWWPTNARPAAALALTAMAAAGVVTFTSYQTQRHMNAGIRFSREGDFVSARREFRLAYDSGVRSAGLLNELGWVEIESGEGDPRVAVEFAGQAIATRPDNPDFQDTYGWALHHAGRSADALPHLERAFAADPDIFCIHYHLGEVYLALGEEEKAKAHLLKQIERTDTREAARAARVLAELDSAKGS
jgi:tetratricopeptide (TPR) repeat protein